MFVQETSQLIFSNSYLTSFYTGYGRVESLSLSGGIGKIWVTEILLVFFCIF